MRRFVDVDVVVSEVRETSRKPDEMYPLLERLSPGTRKLEIFARQHNIRPGGWRATDNVMRDAGGAWWGLLCGVLCAGQTRVGMAVWDLHGHLRTARGQWDEATASVVVSMCCVLCPAT